MDDDDIFDEVEETFNRAAEVVQKAATSGTQENKISQDVMLKIYGLYKTSTVGKCTEPKPGIFDPRGRAKWTSWVNTSKLPKNAAMLEYIQLIKDHYSWDPLVSDANSQRNSSSFGGNAVSSFAVPEDDDRNKNGTNPETCIFQWIKENDIARVTNWISQSGNINLQDQDGLSLLHWAVDRGHVNITNLLLGKNADASIKDNEGQTPLDYAITCEHESIISILQSQGNPPTE